jgi:dipeptidyl aminopeptidase/acylaminoacyl peptidase
LDCIDFTYQVDGLTIEGFYVKPKQANLGSLPVVIFNRGGNADFGYVQFGIKMGLIAELAAQGYLVIGSQYRGASTRTIANNGKDEFGGSDVNDVLALPALLTEILEADPTKIALLGLSRGVMQSYLVAKQLPDIKSIIKR